MTRILFAIPPRGGGYSCNPTKDIIEIHWTPTYDSKRVENDFILCLIHEYLHITLYKVSELACKQLHNIDELLKK